MDNFDFTWYLPADPLAETALVSYRKDRRQPFSESQWFNMPNPMRLLPGQNGNNLRANQRYYEDALRKSLQPQSQPVGLGIMQNQARSQISRSHQAPTQAQQAQFSHHTLPPARTTTPVNRGAAPSPNPNAYTFSDSRNQYQHQQRSPVPQASSSSSRGAISNASGQGQKQYGYHQGGPQRSQTSTPVNGNLLTPQSIYAQQSLPYQQTSPQHMKPANTVTQTKLSPNAHTSPQTQQQPTIPSLPRTTLPPNVNPSPTFSDRSIASDMPCLNNNQAQSRSLFGPPPSRYAHELRNLQRPSTPSGTRHDSVFPNIGPSNGNMQFPHPPPNTSNNGSGFKGNVMPYSQPIGRVYMTPLELQNLGRVEMSRKQVQQQVLGGGGNGNSRPTTPQQGANGFENPRPPQGAQGHMSPGFQQGVQGSRPSTPQQSAHGNSPARPQHARRGCRSRRPPPARHRDRWPCEECYR